MNINISSATSIITDEHFHESIAHGNQSFPFSYYYEDIWFFDFHCIDWHWHHEVEFVTVLSGTAFCLIGDERIELPQGSSIFINSGILHRFEAHESTIIPNIVFSPSVFAPEDSLIYQKYIVPILHSSLSYQIFSPKIPWQNSVTQILSSLYAHQQSASVSELHTVRLLFDIWDILFRHIDLSSSDSVLLSSRRRSARLQVMMKFIQDHFQEDISLEQIAASVSISPSSALAIFQSGIHTSPVAYLIQYRLSCAARLLSTTKNPVSSIAEETGFSSSGYFCRKFKERYHMSPNSYRKQMNALF